jgi:PAS domain S-box-containing protein
MFGTTGTNSRRRLGCPLLRLSELGPLVGYHDQLGDVFYAVDKDWHISVANEAALRFAGLSREEAIGALYWAVVPVRDTPLGRALVEAVEGQRVVQIDVESRLRPGTIVRAIAAPLFDGVAVTLRSVSEERVTGQSTEAELLRPEEHLILAAEAAAIGTYEFDLPSGLGYWSARSRAMLGLPDRNRTTEATLFALIDPRDHGRVSDLYRRATEGAGGGRYAAEFRIKRQSDGSARWLSARGRVHFASDGRPLRRVGALIDITEKRPRSACTKARRACES